MKVGDLIPVHIGQHEVAQAEVKEISDGQAVLIVPARRVVMGIRTELTDLPTTEPSTEVIIDGVDRAVAPEPEASAAVSETPSMPVPVEVPAPVADAPVVNAPVVETVPEVSVETPSEP